MDFITGEKFKALADITYGDAGWNIGTGFDCDVTVFCETHKIDEMFRLPEFLEIGKVKLITHNSDGCITTGSTRSFDYNYHKDQIPPNVSVWYAQNLDVTNGGRLHPLPIGLENAKWHQGVKYVEIDFVRSMNIPKHKQLYLNCELSTNPVERGDCVRTLSRLPFTTYRTNKVSYSQYLREMAQHIFVACPEGNGFDTHRMWEALYLRCIPVVKRRVFTERLSTHFPMFMVKDWREVTPQKLMQFFRNPNERTRTMINYQNSLNFEYWKQKILKGEAI